MQSFRTAFHVSALAAIVALGSGCAFFFGPAQRPASSEKVEANEAMVARGKYLAENVSLCIHCHSQRDFKRFSMILKPGTEGGGGDCFGEEVGMPGTVCGSNITPHKENGIGAWTDGEILRAMREGVDRDGETLFPMMPYQKLRSMSDADAHSVVAFLRTLKPNANKPPPTEVDFPVSRVLNFVPEPLEGPVPEPDRTDSAKYGEYLVTIAACADCHTPVNDRHEPLEGMHLAGGQEMVLKGIVDVRTPNLTPDKETGLTQTRDAFIRRFRAFGADPEATAVAVTPAQQTLMPWIDYGGMTEEDLGAIWDYLQTIPAVSNKVQVRKEGATQLAPPAPPPT